MVEEGGHRIVFYWCIAFWLPGVADIKLASRFIRCVTPIRSCGNLTEIGFPVWPDVTCYLQLPLSKMEN